MPLQKYNLSFLLLLSFFTLQVAAQSTDTAYLKVITQRAEKITQPLGLKPKEEKKATEIVANQYQQLSKIHDGYKATLTSLRQQFPSEKDALTSATKTEEAKRDSLLKVQHAAFLNQLSKVMNPKQVEEVKNGMTYNLVNVTYTAYVDMIPRLKDDEKTQIKTWLVEARELAIDAGSSDGKHAVFGKYKGRINNYLSKQGYDSQKERADWEARIKARKDSATRQMN